LQQQIHEENKMMRVLGDVDKCEGYANCVVAAPDVFTLDDDYIVQIADERPGEHQRAAVEEAVRACPKRALGIVEE
jgi:ferredoxin